MELGIDAFEIAEILGAVEVVGVPSGCLSGDLNGVLKGERNGLERVVDAALILRRFAAGVDILVWVSYIRFVYQLLKSISGM